MRYSDDDGGGPEDREPRDADAVRDASGVTITGAHQAVPRLPNDDEEPPASLEDWAFVRGAAPDTGLPHWTEAPTGQVPAVLARDDAPASTDDPWSSVSPPSWRQDESDWTAHESKFEPAMLGDDQGSTPAGDAEAKRPWEFDVDDAEADDLGPAASAAPATRVRARQTRTRRPTADSPLRGRAARPAAAGRDMSRAVITGVVLGLIVLVVFLWSTVLTEVLAAAVVTVAAGEAFSALRTSGHRPAAALGLVASLSLMVATYNKGLAALPLVAALCFFFTFLWFLGGVEQADIIDGVGTSMLVFVWVAVLGSFAGLLLAPSAFPANAGVHLLLGAIIVTVANDVGALVTGKLVGNRLMARSISPNKTWEGAIGAAVASIALGLFVGKVVPHWTVGSGFVLGLLAAVLVPLGDLCESMFKRSIGVKDMGRFLPGHGGFLDRVDGLLFMLPATYYVALSFHLH